jgi:hypothetical protein
MNKNLVLILLGIIVVLLVFAILFSQKQKKENGDVQKVSSESSQNVQIAKQKKVDIYFASEKTSVKANEFLNVSVMMKNTSINDSVQVNVGEVDVNFDSQVFSASIVGNNPCNPSFLYNVQQKMIKPGDIYIVCSLGGGDPLKSLAPGETMKLADFILTLNPGAIAGPTRLTFVKTNVPNAGDLANLGNLSENGVMMEFSVE